MKIKVVLLILLFIVLANCTAKTHIKVGTYKDVRLSKIDFAYLYITKGIRGCTVNSELILNSDSSFVFTTCGSIRTGIWVTNHDSLFLEVETNRFRSDSLNQYGYNGTWPEIPQKPIGLKNTGTYLERIFQSPKGGKIIERLKFNVP